MNPVTQIRCSNCNEWNLLKEKDDTCGNCGSALVKEPNEAEQASILRRTTPIDIRVPIFENDNLIVKMLKHIFNAVQMVFLAILSFFLWFIAAGPG